MKGIIRWFPFVSPVIFAIGVYALGAITPGYNHLSHTISRLAIMKYGVYQIANMLQLAIALFMSGNAIADTMHMRQSKQTIQTVFYFTATMIVLAAATRTDPIENIQLNFSLLTPMGMAHYSVVGIFLLAAPFGIRALVKTLSREPHYATLSDPTAKIGYLSLTLSIVWIVCFVSAIFLQYRGILQKIIVTLALGWVMRMYYRALHR